MKLENLVCGALVIALGAGLSAAALAQDAGQQDPAAAAKVFAKPAYSPYAGRDFPTRPFFGDTHLHTAFSFDAGAFGARLGPRDAYRFARGEEVTASSGQPVKLSRPLDFLVVADHSDNMGFFPDLFAGKPELLADPTGRRWYDMIQSGKGERRGDRDHRRLLAGHLPEGPHVLPRHARLPQRLAGDDRGGRAVQRAGPLHGLHRLRVDLEHRRQQSASQRHLPRQRRQGEPGRAVHDACRRYGSDNPRDLWKWMDAYEQKTGGSVLAIAHNGNLSNGRMFPVIESFPASSSTASTPRRARVGAALRGHADQGRRRDAPVPLAQRRVRELRALGQGQPRRQRAEEAGDARVRVRALGAQERPQARAAARHESVQVRAGRHRPMRTRASPRSRRTTSSARPPRRSRARSG